MARQVMTFRTRLYVGLAVSTLAIAAVATVLLSRSLALRGTAFVSGWLLLAMVAFLALYNLRKKLTYPPLMRSSSWLQLHIYVGFASVAVFFMHTGVEPPNGAFETMLWLAYLATAASGLIGLSISRAWPRLLTRRGEEVIFERIPRFRRELREEAESLVLRGVEQSDTTTLADFYAQRLAGFLAGPRHYWHHVLASSAPRKRILADLDQLDRYLDDSERRLAAELARLIETKDALDYHHALQGTLKRWLFVHIPLTYTLVLLAAVHAVLVHAYDAGLS